MSIPIDEAATARRLANLTSWSPNPDNHAIGDDLAKGTLPVVATASIVPNTSAEGAKKEKLDEPKKTAKLKTAKLNGSAKNVFEAIARQGQERDFEPSADDTFLPTDAPAGSAEKIEILRRRVDRGQPLWHKDDRIDYAGLIAAIRPRD